MKHALRIAPALLVLTGCISATVGQRLSQEQLSQIKDGVTTMAQVEEMLGKPFAVATETSPDTIKWTYRWATGSAFGSEAETYTFTFKDGIVQSRIVSKEKQ